MLQNVEQLDASFLIVQTLLPFIKNKTFVDIGAGKGVFAKLLMDNDFSGTLFEPLPKYHSQLKNVISQTDYQFYPYAIDDKDRIADFYFANDFTNWSFDSRYYLSNDTDVRYKKTMSVICRSLDSLIREGVVAEHIGILKTEVRGSDLRVLQGMDNLNPEIIYCEFFMPDAYIDWEHAEPYKLIEQAKSLGFKNYIAIKRVNEFAFVSLNPKVFIEGQRGNLIFIQDDIFTQCAAQLEKVIISSEAKLFQMLSTKQIYDHQLLQTFSEQVLNILQSNLLIKVKESNREHIQRQMAHSESQLFDMPQKDFSIMRRLKSFIAPRLNLSNTHPPKPMHIPQDYYDVVAPDKPPVISIVTPSFNQAEYLERTMKSVLDQGYPKLEYIVQDGGSSDDSAAIIEKYADVLTHWESKRDKGQSNAINLGFQHATGEIMAYLNSDDLLLPGTLDYVANFFAAHPDVDVVYGHRILIDRFDQEIGRWVLPKHDNEILSWADYVPQETLFWRRSIWNKIGGNIDESFQFAMDWDLILRLRDAGAKFVRLPRFLGAFRLHLSQKSLSKMEDTGFVEMTRLRQRCHGRAVRQSEIRRHLYGYLLRHIVYQKLYRLGFLNY